MRKTFKYRLYPKKETEQKLYWTLTRCRELYNAALSERRDAYRYAGKSITYYDQQNDLPEIKAEIREEYQDIAAHVLQDVLRRLDKAFQNFFRRCRNGENPGYPRFQGRNRYASFTYPDGAGWKFDGHDLSKGKKALEKRQQALSRKKRGSHRREKARKLVAKAHCKIARQRKDFLHKASKKLVERYQVMVFEDIKTNNLTRKPTPKQGENGTYLPNGANAKGGLNKSILDAGWGTFVSLCSVKAAWAGRTLIKVSPRFTSQVCSGCGQVRKKELSERWHSCECGTALDRDVNAAINILERGRRQRGVTCVEAPCL